MIEAKVIKDSISPGNVRLTTFVLTYPRFIHSEFMTHRVLSRNASSSRAIPVKRQIQEIIDNPAVPLSFTKNKKGMQGGEALTGHDHDEAMSLWLYARDRMVNVALELADMEVHKQYVNRILEPFAHITVVCTATDYDNFFALRYHPDAQPEICELAKCMYEAREASVPKQLADGDWHLPFVDDEEMTGDWQADKKLIKKSVARCARVSYKNHDGTESTIEQDLALYDRLVKHKPIHASPTEHQAMAVTNFAVKSGNFRGWVQYRKTLLDENVDSFTLPERNENE
jgi:thymidylate synthase ThyX